MRKILLLEDDELFSETLEDFLEEEGFCIDCARDGEEALSLNYESRYDLYLLDINVPKMNGLEVLKAFRAYGDETPTIYLTSYKDKQTLQEGFLSGADDFLRKPVDMDELLLRINSLLKRCGKSEEQVIINEHLIYKPKNRRVYNKGEDLNLPIKVIELLELCLQNRQEIITKEMIVNALWDANESYSEGSIRVYINQLKKVLGQESLLNIKGVGYKVEF